MGRPSAQDFLKNIVEAIFKTITATDGKGEWIACQSAKIDFIGFVFFFE